MKILLPHLADVVVAGVRRVGSTIRIDAESQGEQGQCPYCGGESARVHSRYRRELSDTATGGHPVLIDIKIRRFFCDTIDCAAQTSAEKIPDLTQPWARRTPVQRAMIGAIGLAVAGRAAHLGVSVDRDTLLHAIPDRPIGNVSVLGIDDFAIRRGHVYGTIGKPGVQPN